MAKSIVQENKDYCFLCSRNGSGDPLEEHHIFGGNPGRRLSEEDGLKVYLCGSRCHRLGKDSAHQSRETRRFLQHIGQEAWEKKYGTREQFRARYGKSYL